MDIVDPRLRALSGYQKKLRSAIIHALDHVVELVDSLPVSLQLHKVNFLSEPELTAYFSSYSDAQKIVSLDPILKQWLVSPDNSPQKDGHQVVTLLLMEMQEQISDDALEINLTVLHNITGKKLIAQLLTIAYEDLPPQRDFIHEAEKYLH